MEENKTPVKAAKGAPGILKKLFEIQTSKKGFANTEDSGKKNSKGRNEYRYTPGWEIIEYIREKMDALSLMLIPEFRIREVTDMNSHYYRNPQDGGPVTTIPKVETRCVLEAQFTWIDIESGETYGPLRCDDIGVNGTDKSAASAKAFAQRTFLLKFFMFSTRDADDEPDAIDPNRQPQFSSPALFGPAAPAAPVQTAPAYMQQPAAPAPATRQVPAYQAPSPYPGQDSQGPRPFDPNAPEIQQEAGNLMRFQKGTASHQREINEAVGRLTAAGYNCFTQNFLENLVELGQAAREGRQPMLV